ncbi:hypothetical protein BC830DRAFT_1172886 [Chytriomyces sp. MP71]|nr:hypothetical protein BC830DRAFT_1172886 [Chytriomyces sp. MP71]
MATVIQATYYQLLLTNTSSPAAGATVNTTWALTHDPSAPTNVTLATPQPNFPAQQWILTPLGQLANLQTTGAAVQCLRASPTVSDTTLLNGDVHVAGCAGAATWMRLGNETLGGVRFGTGVLGALENLCLKVVGEGVGLGWCDIADVKQVIGWNTMGEIEADGSMVSMDASSTSSLSTTTTSLTSTTSSSTTSSTTSSSSTTITTTYASTTTTTSTTRAFTSTTTATTTTTKKSTTNSGVFDAAVADRLSASDNPPDLSDLPLAEQCTQLANYARRHYNPGVSPLTWDETLVPHAQNAADYAATLNCWDCHSDLGNWGQNLFLSKQSCQSAYAGWVTREAAGQDPVNVEEGHFRNVVGFAAAYTSIGCAVSVLGLQGAVVCNYGFN